MLAKMYLHYLIFLIPGGLRGIAATPLTIREEQGVSDWLASVSTFPQSKEELLTYFLY